PANHLTWLVILFLYLGGLAAGGAAIWLGAEHTSAATKREGAELAVAIEATERRLAKIKARLDQGPGQEEAATLTAEAQREIGEISGRWEAAHVEVRAEALRKLRPRLPQSPLLEQLLMMLLQGKRGMELLPAAPAWH